MAGYLRVLRSEWLKLGKPLTLGLILFAPLASVLLGSLDFSLPESERWRELLVNSAMGQGLFFLPLFTGIFAASVCRSEHLDGGWKQLLALPVGRSAVYLAKLTLALGLIAAMQLLFLAAYLGAGALRGLPLAAVPWSTLLASTAGGLLGALPIAALQLAVSVGWSSFAGPLAVNVVFTIPNILVVNSKDVSPWYPWAQPFLAMMPRAGGSEEFAALQLGLSTVLVVIVGGSCLLLAGGLAYFRRKEM